MASLECAFVCRRSSYGYPIPWKDIRSYIDEGWVGSSVVNAFFALLQKKHDNNHRGIMGYEFGMLLQKNKTKQMKMS